MDPYFSLCVLGLVSQENESFSLLFFFLYLARPSVGGPRDHATAQKNDFIGGIDRSPGLLHLYIVRLIYCALLTPYGAEFARIRRHFCCQPNLVVADRFGG